MYDEPEPPNEGRVLNVMKSESSHEGACLGYIYILSPKGLNLKAGALNSNPLAGIAK